MADPTKLLCHIDGCGYGSEVVAFWKLGRGAEMPFTGGKVGQRDGMVVKMHLCRRHRMQALTMPSRPYKAQLTAWASRPAQFGITFSEAGDLLVPGQAVHQ